MMLVTLVLSSLLPVTFGQFEIFFDMLNGDPLPGGDNDRILAVPEYNNGTEGCDQIADGKVAVQLNLGEFVTAWKALVLQEGNTLKWNMEIEGSTRPFKMVMDREDLALNSLCFWKEIGGIRDRRECVYLIIDAFESMAPNYLYRFYWLTDE